MKWAKLKCSGKGRLELDFSEVKNCKKKKNNPELSFRFGRENVENQAGQLATPEEY